jgi:hypothetical protein
MPRIPIPNSPGFVQAQRGTVLMTDAPGANFKMDESAALINLGRSIGDVGVKVSNAGSQAVSAWSKYYAQSQDTENKLAAAEDRALFKESGNALIKRITENPAASVEDKKLWIEDFQRNYDNARKPLLERMSKDFRSLHDVEMSALAADFADRRKIALIESDIRSKSDAALNDYQSFCDRGEFDEAARLVTEMRGRTWNDQQAKALLEKDLPMRRDFSQAQELAESSPVMALKQLKEVSGEGKHLYFGNLTEKGRRQLVNYAEALAAKSEKEMDQRVLAEMASGSRPYSDEQLTEMRDNGMISNEQFVTYSKWNKEFDRAEQAKKTLQEKAAAASKQQQIYKFMYDKFYSRDWKQQPLSEAEATQIYREAKELYGSDYKGFMSFADDLQKRVAGIEKGTDFYSGIVGRQVKDFLNTALKNNGLFYENDPGWFKRTVRKDDPIFQNARYIELYQLAEEIAPALNNDYEKIMQVLTTKIKQLNEGVIDRIINNTINGQLPLSKANIFDSRIDGLIPPYFAVKGGPMLPMEVAKRKAAGDIDMADVVSEEKNSNGTRKLTLKDGSIVYAQN